MWTYYGTKKKLAQYYPPPENDILIEPFCGAVQYSLYKDNWKKRVFLADKYEIITRVWQYLIDASKEQILKLPDMFEGDNVDNYKQLIDEEKWLIGFCINPGSAIPKKTTRQRSRWNKNKIDIAENIYKIKHWKIKHCDYRDLKNIKAAWYIDPPYQFGGIYYRINNKAIDYKELGDWCQSRIGQIIVCENTKANWLDFSPLTELNGQLHKTMEAIYLQNNYIK